MPPLAPWAQGLIQQGTGAILGMALGSYNDRRQVRQQERLGQQQMRFNKEMTDYQMSKQLEMWKATNYSAQVEELEKAGLNPAMLYGMSGGGGTTTGGAAAGVSAPHAPTGGQEIPTMTGMGLQIRAQAELLHAQRKNIDADTRLKEVNAAKAEGVDTRAAEQQINASKAIEELTKQQTDNARWQYEILKLDKAMKELELRHESETLEERIDETEKNSKIIGKQLDIISNQKDISDATKQAQIQIIQREAIYKSLLNMLTGEQIKKTAVDTMEGQQRIKNSVQELLIKWRTLGVDQQEAEIKSMLAEFDTDPVTVVLKGLTGAINNIIVMGTAGAATQSRTVIQGFQKR